LAKLDARAAQNFFNSFSPGLLGRNHHARAMAKQKYPQTAAHSVYFEAQLLWRNLTYEAAKKSTSRITAGQFVLKHGET